MAPNVQVYPGENLMVTCISIYTCLCELLINPPIRMLFLLDTLPAFSGTAYYVLFYSITLFH